MSNSTVPTRFLLILCVWLGFPLVSNAAELPHKLALGVTNVGVQVHWGFADKWALEARGLKGEENSSEGTISSTVYGLRGYRYFRAPSRVRFYFGAEGAATYSHTDRYDYKTTGFAAGGFFGSEIYLMKRLSVGVDAGPYFLSSKVKDSNTSDSEVYIVINSFMNFYFL